jgi:acetyl-CoA/propionyl-CoA carboxylase biotin carboxyl carrier protein
VRINAEDPSKGRFLPAPGRIGAYREPSGPGVRVDAGFIGDSEIPRSYDSMIAKLITWGADRDEARRRMVRALAEYQIDGVKTIIPFHQRIMTDERFIAGDVHTGYVEHEMDLSDLVHPPVVKADAAAASEVRELTVEVDGKRFGVAVHGIVPGSGSTAAAERAKPGAPVASASAATASGDTSIDAPMQGTIVKVAVSEGQSVAEGDLLVVLEAMKMENQINAPRAGVVKTLPVQAGQNVEAGAIVAVIAAG